MKTFGLFAAIFAGVMIAFDALLGLVAILVAQEGGIHFGPYEIAVVSALLGIVAGAFVYVGKLLIATKDAQIAAKDIELAKAEDDIKDFRAIAADGVNAARLALDAKDVAEDKVRGRKKSRPSRLVPVVPERHSPVTPEQIAAAEKATMRAEVTAVMLALGEPARDINDPDVEIIAPISPAIISPAESSPKASPSVVAEIATDAAKSVIEEDKKNKTKVIVEGDNLPGK